MVGGKPGTMFRGKKEISWIYGTWLIQTRGGGDGGFSEISSQ